MKPRLRFLPAVLCAALLTGCATSKTPTANPSAMTPIQKVSVGLDAFAKGLTALQAGVIQANTQGMISDADTRNILNFCVQGNQVELQASAVTRQVNSLSAADGVNVIVILSPAINAIGSLINQGVGNIKNPQTQTEIKALLLSVQTTLSTIQLAAAGGA